MTTTPTVSITDRGHPLGGDRRMRDISPQPATTCRCPRPMVAADADGDRRCVRCGLTWVGAR
jgi:hypothetical protein